MVLEFPRQFWNADSDFFGAALPGGALARGLCFMFWNMTRFGGAPILAAIISGASAWEAETEVLAVCASGSLELQTI